MARTGSTSRTWLKRRKTRLSSSSCKCSRTWPSRSSRCATRSTKSTWARSCHRSKSSWARWQRMLWSPTGAPSWNATFTSASSSPRKKTPKKRARKVKRKAIWGSSRRARSTKSSLKTAPRMLRRLPRRTKKTCRAMRSHQSKTHCKLRNALQISFSIPSSRSATKRMAWRTLLKAHTTSNSSSGRGRKLRTRTL